MKIPPNPHAYVINQTCTRALYIYSASVNPCDKVATVYVDKSALGALVNELSSPAKAIAESIIHNHGMANWLHRDLNPEVRAIAVQCEKNMLFEDAGKIYERLRDPENAIIAYSRGNLYLRAANLSITIGKTEAAKAFAKKLEQENTSEALDVYKTLGDVAGIRRTTEAIETKQPYAAGLGYIAIGDKEGASRCADALEVMVQQLPDKKEDLKSKVAYLRTHAGEHEAAAAIYREKGVEDMANSLLRQSTQTTPYSPGIKIRGEDTLY